MARVLIGARPAVYGPEPTAPDLIAASRRKRVTAERRRARLAFLLLERAYRHSPGTPLAPSAPLPDDPTYRAAVGQIRRKMLRGIRPLAAIATEALSEAQQESALAAPQMRDIPAHISGDDFGASEQSYLDSLRRDLDSLDPKPRGAGIEKHGPGMYVTGGMYDATHTPRHYRHCPDGQAPQSAAQTYKAIATFAARDPSHGPTWTKPQALEALQGLVDLARHARTADLPSLATRTLDLARMCPSAWLMRFDAIFRAIPDRHNRRRFAKLVPGMTRAR